MQRIVIVVLALVAAGGLGLGQAKAESSGCRPVDVSHVSATSGFTAVSYRHGRGYHYRHHCRPHRWYGHWHHRHHHRWW